MLNKYDSCLLCLPYMINSPNNFPVYANKSSTQKL